MPMMLPWVTANLDCNLAHHFRIFVTCLYVVYMPTQSHLLSIDHFVCHTWIAMIHDTFNFFRGFNFREHLLD